MVYKVSVEKCDSYEPEKLRKVLEKSLENIGYKLKENQKVLIKPNLLGAFKPEQAITTNPAILEELCKILKGKNCEIFIGDSAGHDTENVLEVSKINTLSKYGKILNFDKENFKTFEIKGKKVNLPKILFEVDLIINFAKMKTHVFTGVTLCSKNLYGCIPGKLKNYFHKLNQTHGKLSEILIELNKIIKPQLNFIDAIVAIEGNGPAASGEKVDSKLVLVSENIFAVDIIGTEIMGFDVNSIETNKLSGIKKQDIKVIGEKVEDVKMNFKKPSGFINPVIVSLNKLFPNPRISFDKEKCKKCNICENHCPVKVISLETNDGFPVCNNKDCILCFCCVEMCPYDAVYLQDHWTKRFVKSILKIPEKAIKRVKSLIKKEEVK